MANNKQKKWQQHLDRAANREEISDPQTRRLHSRNIRSLETNHNSLSSPMLFNQQQISRQLGAMSMSSYEQYTGKYPQLPDAPTVPSQMDIDAQFIPQQAHTNTILSFPRESQKQLQRQQQREPSLERKLNDLREIHDELNLSPELRKEEEEELLSQYLSINKKTKLIEVDSLSLATDISSHRTNETERPEDLHIDWKVDNFDYNLAVNAWNNLTGYAQKRYKSKFEILNANFKLIRDHRMDMESNPNYTPDNRSNLREAFKKVRDTAIVLNTENIKGIGNVINNLIIEFNGLDEEYNRQLQEMLTGNLTQDTSHSTEIQ